MKSAQDFRAIQLDEKMDKPLVSVIIIFLNEEKFIREAIESVSAQTYDNWELLLVDDGSSDASTEIALQYAEQYPIKVRYLEHESHQNRGMSASRNLGVRQSTGEYVAFLDADDVWLPDKLEEQVAILSSHPEAAMICGPVQWWYSWTGNAEDIQRDHVVALPIQPDTLVKPPHLLACLLGNETVTTTSGLVRRKAIESVGGLEESFRGLYEDQAFCAKLCSKASVFVASGCWYRWRKHPRSSCSVAVSTGQYRHARLTFLRWLEKYLRQQGIKNSELWEVLQKERWRCYHPILYRLLVPMQHGTGYMKELLKRAARRTLPGAVQRWLLARWYGPEYCPPVGWADFGSMRRLTPVSRVYGFDRGFPIDRYYIEGFLSDYSADILGHVLEIGDNTYTRKFGGDRVTRSDVLHAIEGNPKATMVADLTCAEHIPSGTFDC